MRGDLKDVVTLAWPMVVGMLSITVIDLTDTLVAGWLGKTELAAVGTASTIAFLVNAFFVGFFEGVKILVAQATGAGQHQLAKNGAWHGVLLAIPCGAAICCLIFAQTPIFALFGGSALVQEMACDFFSIRVLASPFWFVIMALICFYQGCGNTRLPMQINLLVCIVNVFLDIVLTFYGIGPIPPLGVLGPAYATLISIVIGMVVMLVIFIRRYGWSDQFQFSIVRKLIRAGLPVGIRFFLQVGAWTVCTSFMAHMGDAFIAANQITAKVLMVSFLANYGTGEAACILTGQCVGAENENGVYRSYQSSVKVALFMATIYALIMISCAGPIAALFQSDPEVLSVATGLMMVAAICQIFDGLVMTAAGALNGTGDTRFTMYVQIGATWVVTLPLGYWFGVVQNLQALGVWYAFTLESLCVSLILIWRFRSGGWKNKSLVNTA